MTDTVCVDCDKPMRYRPTPGDGYRIRKSATRCQHCHRQRHVLQPLDERGLAAERAATLAEDGIVDPVAVRRAADGDLTLRLTRRELINATAYLTRHEYSADEIAERLGVTERTVVRWRGDGELMTDPAATMAAA